MNAAKQKDLGEGVWCIAGNKSMVDGCLGLLVPVQLGDKCFLAGDKTGWRLVFAFCLKEPLRIEHVLFQHRAGCLFCCGFAWLVSR